MNYVPKIIFNQKIVTSFIASNNLSETDFCKLCNIPLLELTKFINNDTSLSIFSILKMAEAMHIDLSKLFKQI